MNTRYFSRIRNLALPFVCLGMLAAQSALVRAQTGLVALYTFKEGSGTNVTDVSGVGTPLNLVIPNPAAMRWLPGGGISIDSP
ncbi:MAG: hypothetical protein Q7R41_04680, partial [Phycisphaerales bacterium]|nr:hypothetical protein [Phycisphaerales bacterium]